MAEQHIKIGDVTPRIQYTADGVQMQFTYPFPIFSASDLEVYQDNVIQAAGFAVNGAGSDGGGDVAFDAAPPNGTVVTLRRRLSIQRQSDFQESGTFRSKVINDELDFLTAAVQQVQDDVRRSVQLSPTDPDALLTLPDKTARQNKALIFDGTGNLTASTDDFDNAATAAAASALAAASSAANATASETGAAGSAAGAALSASDAAASADAAAAIANAQSFRTVVFKGAADSPVSVTEVDNGTLYVIDTSGGNVVVNLPVEATLSALPFNVAVLKTTADANTATIVPGGTDTIDGGATWILTDDQEAVAAVADTSGTPDDWQVVRFGVPLQDGTVTLAKLSDGAKPYDIGFTAGYAADYTPEALAVRTYAKLTMPRAMTIDGLVADIETAPTGADLILDIERNGVSIYSTQPRFAAGSPSLTAGTIATASVSAGDVLTFKATQVGGTEPGRGLTATLKGRLA